MVPNHVFALLGLSEVMRLRKIKSKRIEYLTLAKEAATGDKGLDWQYYLKQFQCNIDLMLKEAYDN